MSKGAAVSKRLLDLRHELGHRLALDLLALLRAQLQHGQALRARFPVGVEADVLVEQSLHRWADLDFCGRLLLALPDAKAVDLCLSATEVLGVDGVDDVEEEGAATALGLVRKVLHVDVVVLDLGGDPLDRNPFKIC